jgi:hypothetical protein
MYTYLQDRRKISSFENFEGNTILSAVITSVVQVAKLALSLHWFLISEPLFEKHKESVLIYDHPSQGRRRRRKNHPETYSSLSVLS